MAEPTIPLRHPKTAAFLAWLIPGLGHVYQGRIGKGVLYAASILTLYSIGYVIGDGKVVYWRWVNPMSNPEKFCLYYLGQFFVGLPSLPALIQATLKSYDLGPVLWGFMAEPSPNVLNGLHYRLRKLVEIGSTCTAVAGLLNVLAIYDAYEGPAYGLDDDAAGQDEVKAANDAQDQGKDKGDVTLKAEPNRPTPERVGRPPELQA